MHAKGLFSLLVTSGYGFGYGLKSRIFATYGYGFGYGQKSRSFMTYGYGFGYGLKIHLRWTTANIEDDSN